MRATTARTDPYVMSAIESNERWIADCANGVLDESVAFTHGSLIGTNLRFPIKGYDSGSIDLVSVYARPQAERHAALIDAIRDVMRDAGIPVANGG